MGKGGLIGLTVPQTSAGQIRAVRSVNHRRTFPVSERAPSQIRDIRNQLIESRINEIDELQFKDWPAAVSGQAARDAEDCRFSERRIENLFWKLGRKFLRQPKHAAFRIFDVLAENYTPRIFFESKTHRLVHGVAHPIFAR